MSEEIDPKEFISTVIGQIKQRVDKLRVHEKENMLEIVFHLKIMALIDFLITSNRNVILDNYEVVKIISKIGDVLFQFDEKIKNMNIRMNDGSPFLTSDFSMYQRMEKIECLNKLMVHAADSTKRKKETITSLHTMFEVGDFEKRAINVSSKSVDISDILNKMKSGD